MIWLSQNFDQQGGTIFRGADILQYVKVMKNRNNAAGRDFGDAMALQNFAQTTQHLTHSLDSFLYSGIIKKEHTH